MGEDQEMLTLARPSPVSAIVAVPQRRTEGRPVVVIFGWGAGNSKDLGEVAPVICPNCHNEVFLHHVRSEKRVSLYFVPLMSYGTDEYLACPICRHGLAVAPEHRGAVQQMHLATASFRKGALAEVGYRPMVERFWRQVGVAPSGVQIVHPSTTVPPPAVAASTAAEPPLADRLANLARLRADGVLTDDEFTAAKRRLLEG